jgi:hypothetical protein
MRNLCYLGAIACTSVILACDNAADEDVDVGIGPDVQLTRATVVGKPYYPIGNWPQGGSGSPISGISCVVTSPPPAYLVHAHVSLYVKGEQIAMPAGIGVVNPVLVNNYVSFDVTKCFYEIHTHDATGVIHLHANNGADRPLTLGQLFDVWGQPLTRENVAGQLGRVVAFVDQQRYEGDLRSIVLSANTLVSLQVGLPLVAPPKFIIPVAP